MPRSLLHRRRSRHKVKAARPGGDHGQSLVELALVLPVLMIVMLLAIDFGHIFLGWVNLQNTARIGADYAATHADTVGIAGSPEAIRYEALVRRDATTINCTLPGQIPPPTFPDGAPAQLNDRAQVSLSCDFAVITPIIGGLVGNTVTIGATAVFPIRVGLYNVQVPPPPSPTATPSPTPTPPPSQCTVPPLVGVRVNPATASWNNAGFDPLNFLVTIGPNNYVIGSTNPANVSGTQQDCATFSVLVSP